MKSRFILFAAALPLALLGASPSTTYAKHRAATQHAQSAHVMLDPDTLKWGDAPPALEKGAQMVVLSGNPGKAGWYVIRLKTPAGFKVAPHWHPTDEQVTVMQGDFSLKMGAGDSEHAHTFAPGGYALLPAHMQHAASTQGGAIV
ncbi:MAG: conserved hypothetical signal peptide protein, partial [Xanthomonadaceae bacterium]|nr:conserved hypothetical signal peptide protein [Xanthomonadaceae bacterium]